MTKDLIFTLLTLLLLCCQINCDVIDQLTRQGANLLNEAKSGTTRQCTCTEETECVTEMKSQGLSCVDECWGRLNTVNITGLLEIAVDRITKTKLQLEKTLTGPIIKIIETVGDFGLCVKDCFVNKNSKGFCFDRNSCQPLLVELKTRKSLRRCTKLIDWKKEAGELCDCSVKAGLLDLEKYCPMLKMIGGRNPEQKRTKN